MATSTIIPAMKMTTLWGTTGDPARTGSITLSEAYTDFDYILVHFRVNVDADMRIYPVAHISKNYVYSDYIKTDNGLETNCAIKFESATSIAVSNWYSNANFQNGVLRVVGIKLG